MLKVSDIEMIEDNGTFQLAIGKSCVTGFNFKTRDACYKSYIVELIRSIEKAKGALTHNTGF